MIDKLENNFAISDKDLENQNNFWSKYTEYFKLRNYKYDAEKKLTLYVVRQIDYLIIKLYQL